MLKKLRKNIEEYSKEKSWGVRPGFELGTFSLQAQDTTSTPAGMLWLQQPNNNYFNCLTYKTLYKKGWALRAHPFLYIAPDRVYFDVGKK